MTTKEKESIDNIYKLLQEIRKENDRFKENIAAQIADIKKKNIPLSLEHQVIGTVQESMHKAIVKSLEDYNSPLKKYVNEIVENHESSIKGIFNEIVSKGLESEDFKAECKTQLLAKIARTTISGLDGSVTKVVNQMKQDSVFRSKLTLVINSLIEEYLN